MYARPKADFEKGFQILWSQPTLPPFAWQSDFAPTPSIEAGYTRQFLDYLELIAAARARLST